MHKPDDIAKKFLGKPLHQLDARARKVAEHVAARKHISRDQSMGASGDDGTLAPATAGQRAADAVASFGGSWTFVGLFVAVLMAWIALNAVLLLTSKGSFDPYPYILLNLVLSMLAAIQAPVILMSQNRQNEKDRNSAAHDYEINLKAEIEIMLLHEKLDLLRDQQWTELLALQKEQLAMLKVLAKAP
jgi:uncharacterized membrane protein